MSWYYYYRMNKPLETDQGIKAKSKRGHFVKNWWATRWIKAYFYEVELQKVTKDIDSVFRIEKILKQRGRRGREEYLVKWMGWPSKFNSWVQKNDIQMI